MPVGQLDRSESSSNDHLSRPAESPAPARIAEIQRVRMIEAATRAAAEVGAGDLTVADVVARAGVSRRTFYEIFEDCEDCFVAAFEDAVERVSERAAPIWRGEGSWQRRVRTTLAALLRLFDEKPEVGRLLIVEALAAGPRALDRRQAVIAKIIAAVDEVRVHGRAARDAPPLTAECVVGGVISVLYGRLLEREPGPVEELLNPLTSMIVMPYLGSAAARREMTRALPDRGRTAPPVTESPLKDLGMRVTYRTARALAAVAAHPGGSNRKVAEACGIGDQGQVSKLLGRLERLGLVENTGAGTATRGAPNEWRLTRRGEGVHGALASECDA
jgi:AcrR family transcriptional regulator